MEAGDRSSTTQPTLHQPAAQVRDPQAPAHYRPEERLDAVVRPARRLLWLGHLCARWVPVGRREPLLKGLLHCQLQGQALQAGRPADGMEPQPLLFLHLGGNRCAPPQVAAVWAPATCTPGQPQVAPQSARWRGARCIHFVDDLLFLAGSYEEALELRGRVEKLFEQLGLARHPSKGCWEPVQTLEHLGLEIDTQLCEFRAPVSKLDRIAKLAKDILGRAARGRRWVPAKQLASLAGKCQFLYLAIPPARYYLRELHEVIATKSSWSAQVRVSNQLRRDLVWWTAVPSQHNRRPILRSPETAYLHVDSSSYGWGAVLNECSEARGYWDLEQRAQHITYKELRAVRHAVECFLPKLAGRRVLLHEDNQAVCGVLAHLSSRSPVMMNELRKLFWLMDTQDIQLRPRYIRSAANVWADRLSRELEGGADVKFNPRLFRHLNRLWGPHSVDRFASGTNALVERYNARWRDPGAEAVDCLRLPDEAWRAEVNWCHPPYELLDTLVLKLRRSGAAATVVAPRWPNHAWHQELLAMADSYVEYPASCGLLCRPRLGERDGNVSTRWNVVAFRLPLRPGQH